MPGIDWRADAQLALLRRFAGEFQLDIPRGPTGNPHDYYAANDMFPYLDAWILQAMLRHLKPSRLIEVGCGYSSLLTARVNREYLAESLHVTCVDPFPPAFLRRDVDGIAELLTSPVQDVPMSRFLELTAGDILFVDTSHTLKTGGDVDFLLNDVLPRLATGVVVHFHDILLPWDYPQDWVLGGRAWNEQYALRAFLAFNGAFEILIGAAWLRCYHPDLLEESVPGFPSLTGDVGGSFWIRRMARDTSS
jgi:hypothetical protein